MILGIFCNETSLILIVLLFINVMRDILPILPMPYQFSLMLNLGLKHQCLNRLFNQLCLLRIITVVKVTVIFKSKFYDFSFIIT